MNVSDSKKRRRRNTTEGEKIPGNISRYILDTIYTCRKAQEDLPDYSKSILHWSLLQGFVLMRAQSSDFNFKVTIRPIFLQL